MKTRWRLAFLLTLPCAAAAVLPAHEAIAQQAAAQQTPAEEPPAPPNAPELQARAKEILVSMTAGNFGKIEAQYDAPLAAHLQPGKLAYMWQSLTSQVGAYKSLVSSRFMILQGTQVVILTAAFERATLDIFVGFDAEGRIGGLRFAPHAPEVPWTPPSYAKPAEVLQKTVVVSSSRWQLPGILSFPPGKGPFPAVVLVAGSGPQDLDETIGPNKPFKDIAYGLASRGIAVLRYTKRTKQYGEKSSDDPAAFTVNEETVSDARAAVALLAAHPLIDPKRIYVLGHSLGAYLAPRIASGDVQVAGLILLAGNTRPLGEVIAEQVRYLAGAQNLPAAEAQRRIDAAEAAAREIARPDLKSTDLVDVVGAKIPGSYWLDLRGYHPAATAAKLAIPMLILQGERDYQVRMADFEGWKKALGRKKSARFLFYPALNHLFQTGTGPSTPAEYEKPGHVAEEVISDIAAWILSGGKKN